MADPRLCPVEYVHIVLPTEELHCLTALVKAKKLDIVIVRRSPLYYETSYPCKSRRAPMSNKFAETLNNLEKYPIFEAWISNEVLPAIFPKILQILALEHRSLKIGLPSVYEKFHNEEAPRRSNRRSKPSWRKLRSDETPCPPPARIGRRTGGEDEDPYHKWPES